MLYQHFSFRDSGVSSIGNSMNFPVQHFPAVSSINLFNLGSFLFLVELYHNLSAKTTRSIQLDRSDGWRIFICFILLEAFPYGLSTAGLASVACCGKGEKAYWIFFFGGDSESYWKMHKKRCSGFWIEVLCLFYFGRASEKVILFCIVFTAVSELKICM